MDTGADIENAAQRNDFFDTFLKRMITATMEIGSATHLMSQLFGIASFGIKTLKCYALGAILPQRHYNCDL